MKIAMIGLRGIPARSGGVEAAVENLAPLLVRKGFDVTVYCRTPYCEKRPKTYKGVRLVYLPTINTKYTEAIVHSFLATIHSLKHDIIHYHALGNALWTVSPKKTVLTIHGFDYEREKWGAPAKAFLKIGERIASTFPNEVISVSKKIHKHFLKKYSREIDFIPNGVTIQKKQALSTKFNIRKGEYILFLSRIVPEKGVHYLIDAYKKLKTGKKLVIVGDATHTDDYLRKLQKQSNDQIIFTGPIYGKEKSQLFSNAYCFVLPSTIEGLPIVLLEAMSFGLCPLVSDIEENKDVIGNLAFSFKARNTKDLKRQLEYMLKYPAKVREQGKKCKKLVQQQYRWPTVAQSHAELYRKLK